ncbi:MAG: glycosyltransferase, partial [Rhodovibrionaceae bacterium]|nr:glycosyltransferase [Rhodovibrionaceae bacterium]
LLRRDALEAAGGFAAIRGAIIDDCALARAVRDGARPEGGRLWLGLTDRAWSLRRYATLESVWRMVSRSAYTQLRYSPLALAGTLAGMALLYLVAPASLLSAPLHSNAALAALGALGWALMAVAIAPTLRLYRQPVVTGLALPLAALLYSAMTFDSALAHMTGRRHSWRGRATAVAG